MVPTGGTYAAPRVAQRPEQAAKELPYAFFEQAQRHVQEQVAQPASLVVSVLARDRLALRLTEDEAVRLGAQLTSAVQMAPLMLQGGLASQMDQDIAPETFATTDLRQAVQAIRDITRDIPTHAGAKSPGAHPARMLNMYTDEILDAIKDKVIAEQVLAPALEQIQGPSGGR